jgi:hypothetical protein
MQSNPATLPALYTIVKIILLIEGLKGKTQGLKKSIPLAMDNQRPSKKRAVV